MTTEELTFQELATLLEEAQNHFLKPVERNIFSIGGKGHYENPISDVLAFFCDSSEGHGLGVPMVRALFKALLATYKNQIQNQDQDQDEVILKDELVNIEQIIKEGETQPEKFIVTKVAREEHTGSGYIDIVLKGTSWVMTIENKIRHWQANNFTNYRSNVTNDHKSDNHFFVVLSPNGEVNAKSAQGHWFGLSYKNLLDCIKDEKIQMQDIFDRPSSKWPILLREFILNLEEEIMPEQIDDKDVKYFFDNAHALAKAEKEKIKQLRQVAIKAFGKKLQSQIEQEVYKQLNNHKHVDMYPFIDPWGSDGEYNHPKYEFKLPSWKPIDCRVQLCLEHTGIDKTIDSCTVWYGVQSGRGSNVMKEHITNSCLGKDYDHTSPGTWYWYKCTTSPNFNIDDPSEIVKLVVEKLIKLNDFVNEHNSKN